MQQVRVRQKLIDFKLATNVADQTSGQENIGGATAPLAPPGSAVPDHN